MAIKLRQDEVIQKEAHFHWTSYLISGLWAFLGLIFIIGIVAANTKVGSRTEEFSYFWSAVIWFGPILYVWLKNKTKSYVVTNQRLYVEEGIISKSKVDLPFNKINDITFKQGIIQRIFGAGNIEVMTGNDKPTRLANLDLPEQFREALSNVVSKKVG